MSTFTDDFNRADAASLGANYGTESGVTGSLAVASNRAAIPDVSGALQDYSNIRASSLGADQYSQAKIQNLSSGDYTQAYVSVRGSTSALQGYRFYFDTGGVDAIYDLVDDVDLATGAHSVTPGDIVTLIARGSILNAFINGTREVGATDATTASGQPGLGAFGLSATVAAGDAQLDDHAGGDLPVITPVAGTVAAAASGNVTPGAPASGAEHDLLVMVVHSRDQVAHTMSGDWTQRFQGNGGSTTSRLSIWTHQRGASNPASFQVTHSAGDTIIARCFRLRAFESGQRVVFDVVGTAGTGTDGTIEHPSITPTADYALLCFVNGAGDDNTRTTPAGVAALFTETSTLGNDGSLSVMYRDAMAAATGDQSITQAAADPYCGVQIAFKAEAIPAGGSTVGAGLIDSVVLSFRRLVQ